MSIEGLGFILRVKLATQKPGMHIARQLNDLDKPLIGRYTTERQASSFERLTKLRIKFVPMSMPLANLSSTTVNLARQRLWFQLAGPGAKSHSSAQLVDIYQIS